VEFNLADLFEAAVDAYPDRDYLVANGKVRTYAQMEARANRLAHHFASQGIGSGDHVGIYAYNCVEWVETAWAVFKLRAVWININYRYVEDELRYLFSSANLQSLVFQRQFSDSVTALLPELRTLRHLLVVEDGSEIDPPHDAFVYEEALSAHGADRDFDQRSADDLYILFTGGTTGMPKGVVWRHADAFFAFGAGSDPQTGIRVRRPEEMVERGRAQARVHLPLAPLMHGSGQWGTMGQTFVGAKVVLVAKFDPHETWRLVEQQRVASLTITGDAMGKPLMEALAEPRANYDLSSLASVSSSAALFSSPVKDMFFGHFPNLAMIDAIGSSESGNTGLQFVSKDNTQMRSGPTVKAVGETVVFDECLQQVEPGSGTIGRIASSGEIPIGYYNDPEKTAEAFIDVDGVRYVVPGDFATVEADGSITLLGRGSIVINSGGEKIFPEEVESAVRCHPDVIDAIVAGAPDERWGQTVAAIVQIRPRRRVDLQSIQDHCRQFVADYKVPRQVHIVSEIHRSPSGKPDYRWADEVIRAVTDPGPDIESTAWTGILRPPHPFHPIG
jgi:acyl-CoA synthetase (AMP-forming)/AMP-acid ligase II